MRAKRISTPTTVSKKDKAADLRMRREYHISLEEYNKVFKHQGRVCAICKRPVQPGKARLAIDHCHTTGQVRGLLCWPCNRAIAVFKDDLIRLKAAVAYLTNPPFTIVFKGDRYTAPGRVGTKRRAKMLLAMRATEAQAAK